MTDLMDQFLKHLMDKWKLGSQRWLDKVQVKWVSYLGKSPWLGALNFGMPVLFLDGLKIWIIFFIFSSAEVVAIGLAGLVGVWPYKTLHTEARMKF